MKPFQTAGRFLSGLLLVVAFAQAQEKPKAAEPPKAVTPMRVQVVFSEMEGEKKLSSLPYVVLVNADDRESKPTSLRMGLRVPILFTTKESPAIQHQYIDVGTDIDCRAESTGDGRYMLHLTVRRSSIYSAEPEKKSLDWKPGEEPLRSQPIVREFRTSFNLLIRDGQSAQATVATDPVSGRVLRVDVSLNTLR